MDWLEQNIDAYRIISKILRELRTAIREVLEHVYGDDWHSKGLPVEVFDRLVAAKEREQSIDWYDGQYQQIMDYSTFLDLSAIIEKNSDNFSEIVRLAPSVALLQARFLELDVMRAKLGRARPISETELSFLGTFHVRFRKATDDARQAAKGKETAPPSGDRPEGSDTPEAAAEDSVEDDDQNVSVPPTVPEPEKTGPPRRPVQSSTDPEIRPETNPSQSDATGEDHIPTEEIPLERDASSESEPEDNSLDDDEEDGGEGDGPEEETTSDASKTVGPKKLQAALETNDHQTVLRQLYREVTTIAEGVWSNDVTPAPMVWDQVTSSDWYELNFSRLGLQSLSAFYEITAEVESKMKAGANHTELQKFLKDTNFAKTLLSMRDMFKANGI
jgi:hypothetical protein